METTNMQPLVDWLTNAANQGQGFVEREAPLLANEIITYGIITSYTTLGCMLVIGAIILTSVFICWRNAKKICPSDPSFPITMSGIFGGIIFLMIVIPVIMISSTNIIKATYAPRLYLLEKVSQLVN